MNELTLHEVRAAHDRIRSFVHCTPVLTSQALNTLWNADFHFKAENFQRSGAFKVRGAFNAILSLTDSEVGRGVVTSSSGNQAAALSLAAGERGIKAYVAMPKVALPSKIAAVRRYGGEIIWVEGKAAVPTSEEYDAAVARIQANVGAAAVHPYNDPRTIAGAGTCLLEFLNQASDLDVVLAPVGGGGLLSGTALTAKSLRPRIRVIGCEPRGADDAQQSFVRKRLIPQLEPRTIADGLRTSLGVLTLPLILSHVDEIVTVSEGAIAQAMRLVWEVLKIVIEPSGAVPVAAILEGAVDVAGQRVGVILSGGNVDLEKLPWMPGQPA